MGKSLTNQIVDQRLKNRTIKRIDNYIYNNSKIRWQCLMDSCNFIWETTPHCIFKGRGCPRCANTSLNNNDVDQRLIGRNIKRLDNYVNNNRHLNWKCLIKICNYIWRATPDKILNQQTGCPKCAKSNYLTNDSVDKSLVSRNIKRIDNVINNKTKIQWKCLILNCGYIWMAAPGDVLRGTGCPKCCYIGRPPLSNDDIDLKLNKRNIKRLDDYIGAPNKIKWQCLIKNCGNIWEASPSNIINSYTGCPKCSACKNEKIALSFIKNLCSEVCYHKRLKDIISNTTKNLIVDFYLPNNNIIIEYNGLQHYKPVQFGNISIERAKINFIKQIERDEYLEELCKNNNITLIWIDGRRFKGDKLIKYINNTLITFINLNYKNRKL